MKRYGAQVTYVAFAPSMPPLVGLYEAEDGDLVMWEDVEQLQQQLAALSAPYKFSEGERVFGTPRIESDSEKLMDACDNANLLLRARLNPPAQEPTT